MSKRSGVRHNQRANWVTLESTTVRDTRLSYRALGLLTYCHDQADSWQVRSEQLARGEGREGRDAVRKALHELAAHGYYRLERRRFLDGTTAMGAAISRYPVEQWARDYLTFNKKLDVPVVEQEDGSFHVRYPDGSLRPDGFTPGPDAAQPNVSVETEPVREPKPRQRRTPPAAARAAAKKAQQPSSPEDSDKAASEVKEKTPAQEVATWYYDHAAQHLGPYAGKQKSRWYFGLVKLSQQALDAEYTQKQVAKALQRTGVHFPTAYQFQRALSDERNNKPMPSQYGSRPAPYSDAATWGTDGIGELPTPSNSDDLDEAVFGIVPA
ncbi:hypothetical protein OG413_20170 [Streptomyces sp. NBC_01433]|uniref:hypothetical protein n=1 Tax=Streptomyces sp. NBC_01433 TaxID=2903864 RepID=UPI002255142B|nr:hypothetical protein [Streptomyces sp. NBC_01433]MCX4677590.1 hypothetical protein [Streptomyces sp. NBC_01433]